MTGTIVSLGLIWALGGGPGKVTAAEADSPVGALIERIAPGHAADFILETIPASAGANAFAVEARDGKIVLGGDTPLSQAVAFNWYLKHDAFVDVSWYADDAVRMPEHLPPPAAPVRQTTRVRDRFFLNYCTFGYTMPFWHWRDWERGIDWMALNGINLPLAQTGNEYIWQEVWRSYGLGDDDIRAFFTGPAHLPWHRMLNIDHWQGPLPQSYIDGQHDLQQKILARERSLGMSPVLCAFAGHVPAALKTAQPALKIERIPPGWGAFSPDYGCWFLNPLDPKFREIQVKFLQAQQKEYGTSHYYGTDPFNEISPPDWDPAYLANVAQSIYGGLAAVDPDAVWLQMAWTFHNDRRHWTDERLSAMIGAVPTGHMELIDYVCESDELYRDTKAFYGAPFIWDYLGNFGGNTHLVGPLNKINERVARVMNDRTLTNFAGVGATLEGFNNPVVYEMLFDRVWAGTNLDLADWVTRESRARAGGPDAACEQAWQMLREKILRDDAATIGGHGVIFQARNPALRGDPDPMLSAAIPYANKDLARVWGLLLQAGPAARATSAYQRDLADTTRQVLGNLGAALREQMADAYDRKDAAVFARSASQFITLGNDLDAFLGTRGEFLLGKWVADARSWASEDAEPDYYEKNARSLITIWGGGRLTDYAGRQWNGLLRDYYLPRWQLLINATLAELKGGPAVDRAALEKQWRAADLQYAETSGSHYLAEPRGGLYLLSRELFDQYAPLVQ